MGLANLKKIVETSPHFKRSINIKIDQSNQNKLKQYIPSDSHLEALDIILDGIDRGGGAYVLHGPYGTGKSLLGVILINLLSGQKNEGLKDIEKRVKKDFPQGYGKVKQHFEKGARYLPLILNGDQENLENSLLRALNSSLKQEGLEGKVNVRTRFKAVLETIKLWEEKFPETFGRFQKELSKRGTSFQSFNKKMELLNEEEFNWFCKVYPSLAAGAQFNHFDSEDGIKILKQASEEISNFGYEGILIIYDEFGRFLENRIAQPVGKDLSFLQNLAEECTNNETVPLSLVLVTHRSFGEYAFGLSEEIEKEWRRIEGRFWLKAIQGDNDIYLRLLNEAIVRPNKSSWMDFVKTNKGFFEELVQRTARLELFKNYPLDQIKEKLIQGCYPLHPLTVYCLPKLSSLVAQNERTLFTFLAGGEEFSLQSFAENPKGKKLLPLSDLYDYFYDAIKGDRTPGGAHRAWVEVENALYKVGDLDKIYSEIIKTIGLINIIRDPSLKPDTDVLLFALEHDKSFDREKVLKALEFMRKKKIIYYRHLEEKWEFLDGSDIDFDEKTKEIIEGRKIPKRRLVNLLEEFCPPESLIPRKYNEEFGMIRFFEGKFVTPEEMTNLRNKWNDKLEKEYRDGFLSYVIVSNQKEILEARKLALEEGDSRVIFAIPKESVELFSLLKDLFAYKVMKTDDDLISKDPRVKKEIDFLMEDTVERIEYIIKLIFDPENNNSHWISGGEEKEIKATSQLSRLSSKICEFSFHKTPAILNEALNKDNPSTVQINAMKKVINSLIDETLKDDYKAAKFGPDVAIVKMVFLRTGLLKETWDGLSYGKGRNDVSELIDNTEKFLRERQGQVFSGKDLVGYLKSPPFGLRNGLIPLIITYVFKKSFFPHISLRKKGELSWPITGEEMVELVFDPKKYEIEIEKITPEIENLFDAIQESFGNRKIGIEKGKISKYEASRQFAQWFHNLKKYARDTMCIEKEARQFRDVIRKCIVNPDEVFHSLLPFLKQKGLATKEGFYSSISKLKGEIESKSDNLFKNIDREVVKVFNNKNETIEETFANWITDLDIDEGFKFSDIYQQSLFDAAKKSKGNEYVVIDLAIKMTGLSPNDWSDQTFDSFLGRLKEAKDSIEKEFRGDKSFGSNNLVELELITPEGDGGNYKFRKEDLTSTGEMIYNNLKNTLEVAGNSLSANEKRSIAIKLLKELLD